MQVVLQGAYFYIMFEIVDKILKLGFPGVWLLNSLIYKRKKGGISI